MPNETVFQYQRSRPTEKKMKIRRESSMKVSANNRQKERSLLSYICLIKRDEFRILFEVVK